MKESESADKDKEPEIGQSIDTNGGDPAIPSENLGFKGITRRSLVTGVGGTVALCALGGVRLVGTTPLVRPPGGQDFDQLAAACIRCEKCVEVCPRHVVKPAHIEHGVVGMRTPTLNFDRDWCNWCTEENNGYPLCVEVCPTEALSLPAEAEQETTILGIAELDASVCLAYLDLSCRFCYDACPFEAIRLDENYRPSIINDNCNGCGACEAVCVVFENASISADALERAVVVRALDEDGKIVNGLPGGGMTS
jgi:ferredoxin-type protein NapG